jgi:uncharacterized membrane protein YhaH (DUF805 family)
MINKKPKVMQTYHLYLNDQIQGPYSTTEIEARIHNGSVGPDTQIASDGGDWARTAEVFPQYFHQEFTRSVGSVVTDSSPGDSYSPPRELWALSKSANVIKYKGIGRLDFAGCAFALSLVGTLFPPFAFLAGLVLMIPAISRFKNIGRNPAWCLLLLVPVLGLFVTVPCLILPPGYEQHRKLDSAAKIVSSILVIIITVVIVVGFISLLRRF